MEIKRFLLHDVVWLSFSSQTGPHTSIAPHTAPQSLFSFSFSSEFLSLLSPIVLILGNLWNTSAGASLSQVFLKFILCFWGWGWGLRFPQSHILVVCMWICQSSALIEPFMCEYLKLKHIPSKCILAMFKATSNSFSPSFVN